MGTKEDMKAGLTELLTKKVTAKKGQNSTPEKNEVKTSSHTPRVSQDKSKKRSRMENATANDYRTSLVIDKFLYQQIVQIAGTNGLSIKDVMNAAMRAYIERYEAKHGPITPPESSISADELI